jgi:hypothetical protein
MGVVYKIAVNTEGLFDVETGWVNRPTGILADRVRPRKDFYLSY